MPSFLSPALKNRFDDFFHDSLYLELKNHLYNYKIRKKKIREFLSEASEGITLEIGSGVSPIVPCSPRVIYTDLSEQAAVILKQRLKDARVLVMGATDLRFESETISTVVCSEVLEHIPNDEQALREIWRVLKPGGSLVLTVPTHAYFFSSDDRYVEHCRRYDPKQLMDQLRALGFCEIRAVKVTGILEKIAMVFAVAMFKFFSPIKFRESEKTSSRSVFMIFFINIYCFINWIYGFFVQLEAWMIPQSMATVMLFHCRKGDR